MVKKFLIEMDIKVSKLIFRHVKCFIPSIAATISSVIFPSFISKIIDDGLVNNNLDLVFLYWVQMLICGTVMVLFNYIHSISYCNFEQRSEERRVGKECIFRWSAYHIKNKKR